MRICMIAEGCYPYSVGGVSGWIHSMIRAFPRVDFSILAILPGRGMSGRFAYELPENVTAVHEVYLDDCDWGAARRRLSGRKYQALKGLVLDQKTDWNGVFNIFRRRRPSVNDLVMGEDFLRAAAAYYDARCPEMPFADFLWTMRSIYLPLFQAMSAPLPEADAYHCVSTGYAGVLGCMAQAVHGGGLVLSEHGIYTREREEELIRADWVQGVYKDIWIEQFRKMSRLAYERADVVTSLFERARALQIELGCPAEKTMVTPNGIDAALYEGLPGKQPEDEAFVDVGAVLRLTPIKDVKTMIRAFALARRQIPALRLWLMGPADGEAAYARECRALAESLAPGGVIFTGRIDTRAYLGRMDFTVLTSISEGQPLVILESFAARRPVIATDVGSCRELIRGGGDGLGEAGLVTRVMDVEGIAAAMAALARDPARRRAMGEAGWRRVTGRYALSGMKRAYEAIYRRAAGKAGVAWPASE